MLKATHFLQFYIVCIINNFTNSSFINYKSILKFQKGHKVTVIMIIFLLCFHFLDMDYFFFSPRPLE